ncbi:hypothetical protein PIB19_05885 [Sphingomonas sp. 7/4-4]|uniref:hypothetical protein n=1 Tax=Sphingomonas sp. 7/4-4 TaxID=3018446 RepID=UPI0022F3F936|nr:hypothetical protein [Sphingomonas sp. 7/4-4]WBY08927.1 hypothetical protein PIB19_05885 [Sphingomonas sp. 7/4-4]
MGTRATISDERRFALWLLLGGLALRLLLLQVRDGGLTAFYGGGEATRIALALARTGTFADAYYEGYGPTAHLLPILPGIAGFLFWLFGPLSVPANLALLGWSLLQTFASYWLLRRLFQRLGMDATAIRWGLALLCLVPVFQPQETIDFRYWEGAAAVTLAAISLNLLLALDERTHIGWRALLLPAALAALTFFVSPAAGLGIYACWGLFALRRLGLAKALQFGGLCAAALALLVVPWAMRNAVMVGEPVPLRSNFGLEIAIANHPAAVSGDRPAETFAERLVAIHPYHGRAARIELAREGGEIAYARHLGTETKAWIAAHPLDFARLSARHLHQFFFPSPWQFYFSSREELRTPRAILLSLVSLFGLLGLGAAIYRRQRGYGWLAIYIAGAALPYAIVQPIPRYSYLVYGMLAFLAVEALLRAGRYVVGKVGPGTAR